jgi:hypothetical protein
MTKKLTPAQAADAERRLKIWRETDMVLCIHHPHPRSKAKPEQ